MARIKKNPQPRGLFSLIFSETEAYLAQRGIAIPDELKSLVVAACWPNVHPNGKPFFIRHQKTLEEDKKVFGKFCGRNTDQAAVILRVIYETLETYLKPTAENKVIKFLLSHNSLKKHDDKFFLMSELKHGQGQHWFVENLTDGELAGFLHRHGSSITESNVKKARQKLVAKGI